MSRSKQKPFDGLSVEDFKGKGTRDERRHEARIPVERIISVFHCEKSNEDGFVQVELVDCSVYGIGIICCKEMMIEERFLVKVQLQKILLAVYTTRFCRPIDGKFQIGAEISGLIGGVNDDPNQMFEAFVNKVDRNGRDAD